MHVLQFWHVPILLIRNLMFPCPYLKMLICHPLSCQGKDVIHAHHRFDLLYLILDKPNERDDRRLAQHLVNLFLTDRPVVDMSRDFVVRLLDKSHQLATGTIYEIRQLCKTKGPSSHYTGSRRSPCKLLRLHEKERQFRRLECGDFYNSSIGKYDSIVRGAC